MIDSKIFNKQNRQELESKILEVLNLNTDFTNKRIISSPRAVGDAAQGIIGENFVDCIKKAIGTDIIKNYKKDYPRRSMEDISFFDLDNNYFAVDIKTHNKSASFNMPNLTSVDRLSKFYYKDNNFFIILLAEYTEMDNKILFDNVDFIPIEFFNWDCLRIGALGKGQIQIADANKIKIDYEQMRKEWMIKMVEKLEIFYNKELKKTQDRLKNVEKIKNFWNKK